MGVLPQSVIEIDQVLVDRRIFTTRFICDVVLQDCHSACCRRGCITMSAEVDRIRPHLESIMEYLPGAKQDFLRQEGGHFIADPARQGTDINPDESWSMIRFFKSPEDMRCTWVVEDGCIFLYPAADAVGKEDTADIRYCAIHSYAMDQGIDWKSFKQTDCVQYPLSLYQVEEKTVLTLQDEPGRSKIPCLNNPIGPLMYRSLSGTITYLLGEAFNDHLQAYGATHFPE